MKPFLHKQRPERRIHGYVWRRTIALLRRGEEREGEDASEISTRFTSYSSFPECTLVFNTTRVMTRVTRVISEEKKLNLLYITG